MRSAIFLDRDGTIIVDKGYISHTDEIVFTRNAIAGLRRLSALGLPLICVSNQSGIGRGYMTLAQVEAVNARLATLLADQGIVLDAWYLCPHAPDAGCACRKPRAGMAHRAARQFNIDPATSFMIGDKPCDMGFAEAVGAMGILVDGVSPASLGQAAIDLGVAADLVVAALARR